MFILNKKIIMKLIGKTKEMFNFTIDAELRSQFLEVADKNSINMSKLLSNMIRK